MKVIAIGGEPGSGKSTLMKALMEGKEWTFVDNVSLVPHYVCGNVVVLGKYDGEGYAQGTDRMSMACQPEVIKFLEKMNNDMVILFEGDRLFGTSFLEHCVDKYDTSIICLTTKEDVRTNRYDLRGSNQNKTWLAGRATKITNIKNNFILRFQITEMENDTLQEQAVIINFLKNKIFGE